VICVEKTLDAPMLHLINMIWNDGSRVLLSSLMNGKFSIEDGNPDLGEHTNLPIKVLKISDSTIVFPAVHPGPFGELGGARMPSLLSEKLEGLVFTLHTPTTHDFNPIRKAELDNIVKAIEGAIFSKKSTCSKLITKSNKQNTIRVHVQVFDSREPVALVCLELYGKFGDVGFEMWEVASQIAKNFGYKDILMVDAHNYYTKNEESARLGTPAGEIIKNLIQEALKEGCKAFQYKVEFARIKKHFHFDENRGFGRDGMGAFAFRCGGETTVYLYFDGNSLLPEMNKHLTNILQEKYDYGIILTTDTHAVHTMGGGYNPIGKNVSAEELGKLIKELLEELEFKSAIPEVASATANLWIWGPDLGTRYLQALDTTLITGKWFLPSILGLTILCTSLITILA
jgi:putative membrane protein